MMSAPICCLQCVKASLAGENAGGVLICEKTGQITGWGSSCADFASYYANRPAREAAGPQRSEDRTACAVAVCTNGMEAATRAHAPALGKAIRTLPSTSIGGGCAE